MKKQHKPYLLQFEFRGVPLQARRIASDLAPSTKWLYEQFAVEHPEETGSPVASIQIFYDSNSSEWIHWPTSFNADHRPLGEALAKARNENPELQTYDVRVLVHKYIDLSDHPTVRKIPIQAANPDDAVFRLRDLVTADNTLMLRSGGKRYVGNVLRSGVSNPY